MFTGIIEGLGKVESLSANDDGGKLRINLSATPQIAKGMKKGDSIAVNGCCLTVVEFSRKAFAADLSGETLRRTSLSEKKSGDPVNLERPLAAGARLGGHFVQGHVDGIGRVTDLTPEGENWWLSVRVPENLRRYVVEKGSISIEGISLTVARWDNGVASIAVVPFTYENTNIRAIRDGDAVNLEIDILAKYVESLIGGAGSRAQAEPTSMGLSLEEFVEQGF